MNNGFWRYIMVTALLILGINGRSWSQSDYMPPMSGWPAAIQLQWQVQGEYFGSQTQDTSKHLGAWVIARGGTTYALVILPGGLLSLPGQLYGGWDKTTRHQGSTGPANVSLNGKIFNVTTATGGFVSDSITGTGEARTMYVHNSNGASYVLQRVKRQSPTRGFDYKKVKNLPGGSGVVSLWDSATGTADLSKWTRKDNDASVKYNYLYRGAKSVANYGTQLLHIEFLSCFNPTATSDPQTRANSGVYLQGHYEAQVLDSYGLSGAIDHFGAVYTVKAPSVNAALPPQVTLQTYDIYFTPRTSGSWGPNNLAGAATLTIYANGVLVVDAVPCPNITTAGMDTPTELLPGPLYLQNHSNEVVFNNIWVVPNATVTTLPYSTILAAAAEGTTNLNQIQPLIRKSDLGALGFGGSFDISGRKVSDHDAVLSVEPKVLVRPKAR
jgi:3-keto-disaccharide hydrolase